MASADLSILVAPFDATAIRSRCRPDAGGIVVGGVGDLVIPGTKGLGQCDSHQSASLLGRLPGAMVVRGFDRHRWLDELVDGGGWSPVCCLIITGLEHRQRPVRRASVNAALRYSPCCPRRASFPRSTHHGVVFVKFGGDHEGPSKRAKG